MNTRRPIMTIVSTAALVAAAAAAGVAPAQAADITHRPDKGESVHRAPVMDDCSLSMPCSPVVRVLEGDGQVSSTKSTTLAVDRTARSSGVADCNVASIRAAARDVHLWSYADDGTLELRVNGVIHRHNNQLLP